MLIGQKADAVILAFENGSYIKITGELAELFTKISNLYRPLLAVARTMNKEGEAIFNDGQGKIKHLSEVVL